MLRRSTAGAPRGVSPIASVWRVRITRIPRRVALSRKPRPLSSIYAFAGGRRLRRRGVRGRGPPVRASGCSRNWGVQWRTVTGRGPPPVFAACGDSADSACRPALPLSDLALAAGLSAALRRLPEGLDYGARSANRRALILLLSATATRAARALGRDLTVLACHSGRGRGRGLCKDAVYLPQKDCALRLLRGDLRARRTPRLRRAARFSRAHARVLRPGPGAPRAGRRALALGAVDLVGRCAILARSRRAATTPNLEPKKIGSWTSCPDGQSLGGHSAGSLLSAAGGADPVTNSTAEC